MRKVTRRDLLRASGLGGLSFLAAACQPKVVEVTKVVKEVIKETVVVEGTPQVVEKEVTKIVKEEVEKVVTATASAPEMQEIIWSTWAGGDAEVNLKQATVDEFNATRGAQLGIDLSARITTDYGGYWTKLPTSFAGGDAPDAVWSFATSWVEWIYNDWIRDLTPYVELEPEVSAIRTALELVSSGSHSFLGRVYGIPHLVQIYGTQFNVEMFDEAGIDYPPANWDDPDWTVQKFTEYAQALTKRTSDGTAEQLGAQVSTSLLAWSGYAHVEGNGGRIFDDNWTQFLGDQPEAVEVGQWNYDLFNKYKVSPTPEEGSAGFSFWNGKVAMMISLITWPARLIESGYGVWTPELAPLPRWKEQKEWSHGIPICCSAQSKYPEAVIEFGRWMVEFGDDMNVGLGYCAPLLDKHRDLLMTKAPGMDYVTEALLKMRREPHLQALDYGIKTNPFVPTWNEIDRDVWGPKVNDVLTSGEETDFGKVISAAKPEIEALLAKAQVEIEDFKASR